MYGKLVLIIVSTDGLALCAPYLAWHDPQYVADSQAFFDLVAPSLLMVLPVSSPASFKLYRVCAFQEATTED